MLSRIIRFSLVFILLFCSTMLFISGSIGYGILVFLLLSLVILSIFKNEINLLAFLMLRQNKFKKAKNILNWIKNPDGMIKSQQAYYFYLHGLIDSQSGVIKEAEKHFKKALSIGLRMKQDQAVAKLNLAAAVAAKRNKPEAIRLLQDAKKLDTYKLLTDQIKMLETQLKKI